MDRRNFLRVTTLAGGGMMLSLHAGAETFIAKNTTVSAEPIAAIPIGDFLMLKPDGEILFQLTKHEMGQGVSTSLAMILSEELGADWQRIKIEFPQANKKRYAALGEHGTGGSNTIIKMMPVLRKAGATVRQMLVEAAAQQWNTTVDACYAEKHFIIHKPSNRKLGFGELAEHASKLGVPTDVKLKEVKDFQLIGKPQSGKLISQVATGQNKYGIDVQVPGVLYALVMRSPVYRGKIRSIDSSKTLAVKGVKKVVTTRSIAGYKEARFEYDIREGVAVIADSYWAAKKGRDVLNVEWDEGINGSRNMEDFEKMVAERNSRRVDPTGFTGNENAVANLEHVKQSLYASYVFPYQLHSLMEPLNCTAHFKGDSCELWLGTQWPEFIINETVRLFNIKEENVQIHLHPSGGGFGRRAFPDMAIEALCISKEAGNVPVKMMWTREDDQQVNAAHCYQRIDYQAALDKDNKLYAWYEKETRTYDWGRKFVAPELTWSGYNIPNIRYDFDKMIEESIVQSTAWRAVMANGTAFSECFMDEVAEKMKQDPLALRLSLLEEGREVNVGHTQKINNTRLIRVLKLVAEKSGWGKSIVEKGKGRGIAVYPYLHGNSYCAMVADVTVQQNKLTVDRVTCAVDCGLVINPSGVKNQIEGGVVWGLTAVLHGGLEIKNGRATKNNFHQNKVLRIDECPKIDVHFIDTDDVNVWGIGELANPVIVPAVLNAVFAATGKRVRKLPVADAMSSA